MKWQDKLTKKELKHLKEDANCTTLRQIKKTIEFQENLRKEKPAFDPCWECFSIGKKLGFIK